MLDFYQILNLESKRNGAAISGEELKQAYRRALLLNHPDKQTSGASKTKTTVDDIAEAYKILGEATARADYDRKLGILRAEERIDGMTRHTGMETIDLADLEFREAEGCWTRACRCGIVPAFVVTEPELEKNIEYGELITGCKGCSLWLKVLFSVED